MSKSRLKNNWIKKKYSHTGRNPHHIDEMPKKKPSRLIMSHCSTDVARLQEPTSFSGHKTRKGGHQLVSVIVRASLKEEFRREIQDENNRIMASNNKNQL